MHCAIPDDQKKLVDECYKAARAKNQNFNVTRLMKCMGFAGKRTEFQKHLNLENKCMRLAIMGYCDDKGCQKIEDRVHQTTAYDLDKEKLNAGLNKFISGN